MSEIEAPYEVLRSASDREEWLEARRKGLGATDVSAILGLNPYKTAWEVWANKTNRLLSGPSNAAMRAGLHYERAVLDVAEDALGDLRRDVRVRCTGTPIVSSCDAVTVEDFVPVEAKTTGLTGPVWGEWGDEGTDEVPESYAIQVHTQMLCTNADVGYLFALIAGRGTVQYVIRRNDSIAETIRRFGREWWERHVLRDEPPEIGTTKFDVVKRLRRETGKTVSLPSFTALRDYEISRTIRLEAEKAENKYKARLLASLGDAEIGELPDGRRVTYTETERHEKARPARVTNYRTLRVRKPRKKRNDS